MIGEFAGGLEAQWRPRQWMNVRAMEAVLNKAIPIIAPGVLGTLGLVLSWLVVREFRLLGNPGNPDYAKRVRWVQGVGYDHWYRATLSTLLSTVDRFFGLEPVHRAAPVFSLMRQSFGASAFDRLLALAVGYPILTLLLGWAITGIGMLGAVEVLSPAAPVLRWVTLACLLASFWFLVRYVRRSGWRSWVNLIGAWLCYAVTVTVDGAVAIAAAFAVASAFAVAGAVAAAFAVASAFAVAGAGAVAGAFAFAGAGVLAFAFAGAVVGAGAGAVVGAGAGAGAVSVYILFGWIRSRYNLGLAYAVFLPGICGLLIAALWWLAGVGSLDPDVTVFLVFLALLPLLNVPLDFVSFAVTRGLLSAIATRVHGAGGALFWGLCDAGLALVLLCAVALTTWGGLYGVNAFMVSAGGVPLVDLDAVLHTVRTGSVGENLWVWMMLGSTLIPTALHFAVACFALFLVLNQRAARGVADEMQRALAQQRVHAADPQNALPGQVGNDTQLKAFVYLWAGPLFAAVFALGLLGLGAYAVFVILPDIVQWLLAPFGAPPVPAERRLFWMAAV